MRRRLLAAPDKFRGSLSAKQVARAMAAGAKAAGWDAQELPLADGGEGTLDALGGPNQATLVTGPLGEVVSAGWRLDHGTAVVEMALASGLTLAGGKAGNDPLRATTKGTGELIKAALQAGAKLVIVAVGGSATTDGGFGALEALGGKPFSERGVVVRVACDVSTRFVDAARVFGPQKGAGWEQVEALTRRLEGTAKLYLEQYGIDVNTLPGSGAAGGLAGGLAAIGAELVPGFDLVATAAGLDAALQEADAVATGEGRLDKSSLSGKVVGGVAERSRRHGVPVAAIVGSAEIRLGEPISVLPIVELYGEGPAWARAEACIAGATELWLKDLSTRPETSAWYCRDDDPKS